MNVNCACQNELLPEDPYHRLHDENPLPSIESLKRLHFTEAVREDTGKG